MKMNMFFQYYNATKSPLNHLFMAVGLLLLLQIQGCSMLGSTFKTESNKGVSLNNERAIDKVKLANKYYQERDWLVSERLFRELAIMVPNDSFAYFQLGNTLMNQYRYEDAIESYQHALSIDPNLLEARNNIATAYMLLAESLLIELRGIVIKHDQFGSSEQLLTRKIDTLRSVSSMPIWEKR